jgi:transketolase
LGSAVAEVLAEGRPTPLERIGVRDRFGEVGKQDYLMRTFGMTAADIENAARKVLRRKA